MNALLKIYKMKQEKQLAMNKSVGLTPKRVFGLRTDVAGNVHFKGGQEIIYPAAGVLVVQDFVTNKQKYLRFAENTKPEFIVISPNRKLLAVSELNLITEKTLINVYDLENLRKLKSLQLPPECPVQAVGYMCFTNDSKGIAMLSQEPDTFITIYTIDKNDTMVTGRASNKDYPERATLLQCNPSDISIVAVGGANMMKLMNKTEKGFGTLSGSMKGENIDVTSLTWLSAEFIIAGSSGMELFFIEGGELKAKYNAMNLELIDLSQTPDADDSSKSELNTIATLLAKKTYPIMCLTTFPTGFAFATNNMVHVFERETPFKYIKKTLLTIPVTLYEEPLYVIKSIAINEQQDTIVATAQHSQIYIGQLFAPETVNVTQIEFKYLGEPLHIDSIIDLSVCSWKSIAMTASKDHTVRIWNYETMKVELLKKFLIDIRVVALHPSGIFAAIGFTDILRLVQIQLKDLKITKSFNYACTVLKFSHRGHLLAAGCEKLIAVISVFTFETVLTLKGHNGILSLAWSTDDRFLVSSGREGSVYEWDISANGERVNELVQKGTLYKSIAVSSDQSYIVGVTHSAYLREISKSQMVREFRAPEVESSLTTLAFSRSDQIMFTANDRGCLYNIKMPFMESGGGSFTNNRFYHKAINRLCISYDDKMLISVGDDGTLVFWIIANIENRVAEFTDEVMGTCEDVLIPRRELMQKVDQIKLLELRINEQISEFVYQKQQDDTSHSEQMRDIHEKYGNALEDLKKQNDTLQTIHTDQLNELTTTITKSNEKHQRETEQLEANFNDKIIIEYDNQKIQLDKMEEMKEQYEEKLKRSNSCLQDTIESLDKNFKKQLDERQEFVNRLLLEIKEKEKEFEEYCRQVEIDHDRNMVESQLSYEKRLKDCEEIITRWRGDAGVLKKKNSNMGKECEDLRKEIELLRSQYARFQETIRLNQKQIDELKHERSQRDTTIREKEKQVIELNKRTQELEKYKQALTNRLQELKSEIEPREAEIREKKERIFEMERELKLLQQQQLHGGLKLSELRDKFLGSEAELKVERMRSRISRDQLMRICSDIYKVSNYIQQSPEKLKEQVMVLYHRYANDSELKKTLLLDVEVQNEFTRQREYFEMMNDSPSTSKKIGKKSQLGMDQDTVKLLKENVTLITELNRLRMELSEKEKENNRMKSLLGTSSRHMLPSIARKKIDRATSERDEIHDKYKEIIGKLEEKVEILVNENQNLRSQNAQ